MNHTGISNIGVESVDSIGERTLSMVNPYSMRKKAVRNGRQHPKVASLYLVGLSYEREVPAISGMAMQLWIPVQIHLLHGRHLC